MPNLQRTDQIWRPRSHTPKYGLDKAWVLVHADFAHSILLDRQDAFGLTEDTLMFPPATGGFRRLVLNWAVHLLHERRSAQCGKLSFQVPCRVVPAAHPALIVGSHATTTVVPSFLAATAASGSLHCSERLSIE